MMRYLLAFFICMPFFAASQDIRQTYVNEQINEAKNFYAKSDYNSALQTLGKLSDFSVKNKNAYGIALSTLQKTFYEIDAEKIGKSVPDWVLLEKLVNADVHNRVYLKMQLCRIKALFYNQQNDLIKAVQYLDEGIKLSGVPPQNTTVLGELYHYYARLKDAEGKRVVAAEYFWKAIRVFEALNMQASIENIYSNLANCYFLMGEKEKAIELLNKAIELSKKNENYENLGIQLSNLSRIYQLSGDADKGLYYLQQSFQYTQKGAKTETQFVRLSDMAFLYHSKKVRDSALKYMEDAITLGREMKRVNLHRYIRVAAMFAGYAGNEALMNRYYEESYGLAVAAKDKDALRDWHSSKAYYYAFVKKDSAKAYPHLISFHAYKDSLLNEKSKKDFNELEVLYETEKKQAEITKLANEQRIQQLELEKKNALLRGNLIEAEQKEREIQLLTQERTISQLTIDEQNRSLSLNKAQIKNLQQQKKITEQENLLSKQKISNEQLKRNLIIAILGATVIAFALLYNRMQLKKKLEQKSLLLKERNRISSELHDEVGSTLTAINLLSHATINQMEAAGDTGPRKQVEKIKENTQSVMDNISDIVWSMNPDNDSMQQVIIRMKEFAANVLEQQGIQYRFHINNLVNEVKMSSEIRRDFYLVFKECLHNLAKYAKATVVEITIAKPGKNIVLTVQDNGTGFKLQTVKKGNGLKNMKMRTEKHGGHFEVSPDKGTRISARFPYT